MTRVVIIEDDQDIRDLVLYALKSNQIEGLGFEKGSDFFKKGFSKRDIDLILLDVMLPDEDGLSLLKKLRGDFRYHEIPIIMLTAKDSEIDKVTALDLGADDYVVKPFGILELMSRIQARLRRIQKQDVLSFNEITLYPDQYEVFVAGNRIDLTNKEYELLMYFLNNPNRVLSREKILEMVWGFDFLGESRTLDIHVSTLRKNLKSAAKYIQTVRGIGYKLGDARD